MRIKLVINFGLLLATIQSCAAQTGYNYPPPEVGLSAGTATIPSAGGVSNAIRPIVGGFSATGATSGGFPTASANYNPNVNSPTTFGFAQSQRGGSSPPATFTSTGVSGTGTGGNGLGVRPTLSQRTGGFYGTGNVGARNIPTGTVGNNDGQYEGDYSAIPGEPGINYPIYSQVPPTSFDCSQQPLPGYYSDVEAQCQVFHICALNRTYSFLCPNGTIFSQETLVCVWWNMFNCGSAPSLYGNNAYIYDYGNQVAPAGSANVGSFQREQQPQQRPGTQQLNLGGTTRQQQNTFQSASRSNQLVGSVQPTLSGGLPGGTFPGTISPQIAASPTTAASFPSGSASAARFPNPNAGSFPTGPSTTSSAAAAFGTTIRPGFSTLQDPSATFPTAQISPTTSNREYLPPRRP